MAICVHLFVVVVFCMFCRGYVFAFFVVAMLLYFLVVVILCISRRGYFVVFFVLTGSTAGAGSSACDRGEVGGSGGGGW